MKQYKITIDSSCATTHTRFADIVTISNQGALVGHAFSNSRLTEYDTEFLPGILLWAYAPCDWDRVELIK